MQVVDSDGDGTSDGDEAAAGTDPFVNSEFNVTGNFEQWAAFSGIASESVLGGSLNAVSSNVDSQMVTTNLHVSGTAVPHLLARMKASASGNAQLFWERVGASGYTSARSVSTNYLGNNSLKVVAFAMAGNADWQNKIITSLRFDPTGSSGANFQIDWIRASTGDLDGDGLSDSFEGDADIDQDGLVNLEDADSDGDAQSDLLEIHSGTN